MPVNNALAFQYSRLLCVCCGVNADLLMGAMNGTVICRDCHRSEQQESEEREESGE